MPEEQPQRGLLFDKTRIRAIVLTALVTWCCFSASAQESSPSREEVVAAQNAAWDAAIAPGQTITFGFNADWNAAFTPPDNYILNGVGINNV